MLFMRLLPISVIKTYKNINISPTFVQNNEVKKESLYSGNFS